MVKRLAYRPWRLQIRGHENWASVTNGSAEPNSQCRRVPLSPWQKAAVAIGSLIGAANNPARADLVAAAGETTGGLAFQRMLQRMKNDEEGREILLHRPRVVSAAVEHAWDMKDNTFGAAYAKFMGSRNFNPDDRPPVRFVESDELAYVATRYREVHDFWHVLFDLPTNLLGEAALKMLEFQVTLMPMCFMAVLAGSARLKSQQQLMLYKHYLPWALSAGRSCSDLMCIYYERHLEHDLEEVRHKWGIITAPPLRQKT